MYDGKRWTAQPVRRAARCLPAHTGSNHLSWPAYPTQKTKKSGMLSKQYVRMHLDKSRLADSAALSGLPRGAGGTYEHGGLAWVTTYDIEINKDRMA